MCPGYLNAGSASHPHRAGGDADRDAGRAGDELLARIAYLYYRRDMTQEEIARELGMSRFKVLRLLQQSRERGIVKIEVAGPVGECLELELGLKALGLDEAIVAPVVQGASAQSVMEAIGRAAAQFLKGRIAGRVSIGIAWGRTVCEVVKSLAALGPYQGPEVTVVQLMGGIAELAHKISATRLGSELAEVYGGQCHFLHAPAIVDSPDLCLRLRQEPSLKQTLEMARSVDVALVGIGSVDEQSVLVQSGLLSISDLRELRNAEACGALCARFFDASGRECRPELSERTVGISFDQFRAVPLRVAVAGGAGKTRAILGALRGRLVNVLVTDASTARSVVDAAGPTPAP